MESGPLNFYKTFLLQAMIDKEKSYEWQNHPDCQCRGTSKISIDRE